jgi:heme/copper-type cytochrome/quinol oxidase subunit 3
MTESGSSLSPMKMRFVLAVVFGIAILVVEFTSVTVPALGLATEFELQAALIGTFIVLLGGVHVTHAEAAASSVGNDDVDVSPTDIQRAGVITALGGFILLSVAFL